MGFIKLKTCIVPAVALGLLLNAACAVAGIQPGPEPAPPTLWTCSDSALQRGLETVVAGLGFQEAAANKHLALALVDITDPRHPHVASINGNHMMYAASLPKITILLAACERIKQGCLTLNTEVRDKLVRMIRNSCNRSATEMMKRVGESFILKTLQSPRYRLYDPAHNGGLWLGKPYGKLPAIKRDPLYNLSHGATALQTARFYYMLENGQLVSPEMSRVMKKILSKPAIHHKFVKGLEAYKPGSRIFRKSGTWKNYHADSAIVERGGRRYIAVALAENPEGGKWFSELIVEMDRLIFAAPRTG